MPSKSIVQRLLTKATKATSPLTNRAKQSTLANASEGPMTSSKTGTRESTTRSLATGEATMAPPSSSTTSATSQTSRSRSSTKTTTTTATSATNTSASSTSTKGPKDKKSRVVAWTAKTTKLGSGEGEGEGERREGSPERGCRAARWPGSDEYADPGDVYWGSTW